MNKFIGRHTSAVFFALVLLATFSGQGFAAECSSMKQLTTDWPFSVGDSVDTGSTIYTATAVVTTPRLTSSCYSTTNNTYIQAADGWGVSGSYLTLYGQPVQDTCNAGYYKLRTMTVYYQTNNCTAPPPDSDGDGVSDASDVCPNTPPATSVDLDGCSSLQIDCSDGLVTQDEEGFDCGGSCSDECGCPVGTEQITIPNGLPTDSRCAFFKADMNGVCPSGFVLVQSGAEDGKECYQLLNGNGYAWPVNDLPTVSIPDGFVSVNYNTATTQDISLVDNGDGTSTRTTTEVQTAGSGTGASSITTTTTETINNTTGEVSYVSINQSEAVSPEDNLGNYDWGTVQTNTYDPDISADLPEESDLTGLVDGWISTSPFFAALNTFEVQTSGAVCSVNLGHVYDIDLVMDLCQWQDDLLVVGALLLSVVQMLSFLVIYRGWK